MLWYNSALGYLSIDYAHNAVLPSANVWHRLGLSVSAPSSAAYYFVVIGKANTNFTAYFDQASIKKVSRSARSFIDTVRTNKTKTVWFELGTDAAGDKTVDFDSSDHFGAAEANMRWHRIPTRTGDLHEMLPTGSVIFINASVEIGDISDGSIVQARISDKQGGAGVIAYGTKVYHNNTGSTDAVIAKVSCLYRLGAYTTAGAGDYEFAVEVVCIEDAFDIGAGTTVTYFEVFQVS